MKALISPQSPNSLILAILEWLVFHCGFDLLLLSVQHGLQHARPFCPSPSPGVLIYISLINDYMEHLFLCLLTTCISSLGKYLFKSLAYFLNKLYFCYWVVRVLYIFWILDLSDTWFTKIFSHSVGCLFNLLIVYKEVQKFLFWQCPVYLFFLPLAVMLLVYHLWCHI